MLFADLVRCFPRTPKARLAEYLEPLNSAMAEFQITAPFRAAAFLANLRHESMGLSTWREIGGELAKYAPYYGRGPIQLTWRAAYEACGRTIGLDLVANPELVLRTEVGFRSSAWFWAKYKGLNGFADKLQGAPSDRKAFDVITARVHGCGGMDECPCRQPRWDYYWGHPAHGVGTLVVMSTPTVPESV